MSTMTNATRKQARAGNTNRADQSAWADSLRLIQNGLASLASHTQRDQYHHAVVHSAEPLPDAVPRDPRIYASGHRVARRIDFPLPDGGHLTHFIFDHNLDAAEDGVLAGFRRELGRVRSILRAMPRKLVPEFDAVPLDNIGPDGHLVAWLSLLHWVAHRRPKPVFKAHLEWLPSKDSVAASAPFVPWYECPGTLDTDPVPWLTLTRPQENGVRIPEMGVVASSLSKPLLYASVNAIEHLLTACVDDRPPAPPSRARAVAGRLDPLSIQLLILLYGHHKRPDESVNDEPLTEQQIADELDCSQATVSRRISRLFGDGPKGTRPMAYYRALCRDMHRIDRALTRLWFKHMEPKLEHQFAVGEMEQFADEGDPADD